MKKIETGVDRLVELVNQEKKISIEDAAKQLGVSKVVVQEWASFLEEEKIITVDYKFSKTFLTERQLSKKEVKEKEKEYESEKDAFVRKVESSLSDLKGKSVGLEKIKEDFGTLKREIGGEIKKVRNEVEKLEKYEDLKKNIDKQIQEQVAEFNIILEKAHSQIEFEQRKQNEVLERLDIEKRDLEVKSKRLETVEEKEKALMERIEKLFNLAKQLDKKVANERRSVLGSEKRIQELEKSVDDIQKDMKEKREKIQPLMDQAKRHEDKILNLQQSIMEKAKKSTEKIRQEVTGGQQAIEKFKVFFEKKSEIENLISQIDQRRIELETQYMNLRKKALAFEVVSKNKTVKGQMEQIEGKLDDLKDKKEGFKADLEKLISLIKG